MAHYLITGGTGLIGSALSKQLIADNHKVTVLSRNINSVAEKCGIDVKSISSLDDIDSETIVDVVVNLAGAPIADKRWSKARKRVLEQSRIGLTQQLVEWIRLRKTKPVCLISGSAVGWYGDSGDSMLSEQSDFHNEYTHQLCDAWEQQALQVKNLGVRVCIVRTGLVLAGNGGFLKKMLLPFKLGLGGRIGNGNQYMPWIHLADMINILRFLSDNKECSGIYNACSPSPVTNRVFTEMLSRQLARPAFLPLPAWFLKLLLGEMSRLLLTGQRAIPEKILATHFQFRYSDLASALNDVLPGRNMETGE